MMSPRPALAAHVVPFALFMLGLALVSAVQWMAGPTETLLLAKPAYWIYPLQSLACAVALAIFWKRYEFGPRQAVPLAVGVGIGVFAGQMWARVAGIVVAAVSILVNVAFLPAYPIWIMIVIGIDVLVIYALAVHGKEMKYRHRY